MRTQIIQSSPDILIWGLAVEVLKITVTLPQNWYVSNVDHLSFEDALIRVQTRLNHVTST